MNVRLITPTATECVTLAQIKMQARLDSGTLADNSTLYSSIAAGSHGVVTGYTLLGASATVLGKTAVVFLQPVNNGTSGTVDVKIQDSDDNSTWTDWTGGAFTQVTEANDTVIQEKQYTGSKAYIRVVAKTLVAACEFGVSILVYDSISTEDDLLTDCIQSAREYVEDILSRALMTQTWDYFLQDWPDGDRMKLPFGNLQNGTGTEPIVKYKDSTGTETTLTVTTDYLVETNGDQCGFIVLPYQGVWPQATLYPSNPISIRFVCGWTSASLIPSKIKKAIMMIALDLFANREWQMTSNSTGVYGTFTENKVVQRLLSNAGLFDIFE